MCITEITLVVASTCIATCLVPMKGRKKRSQLRIVLCRVGLREPLTTLAVPIPTAAAAQRPRFDDIGTCSFVGALPQDSHLQPKSKPCLRLPKWPSLLGFVTADTQMNAPSTVLYVCIGLDLPLYVDIDYVSVLYLT